MAYPPADAPDRVAGDVIASAIINALDAAIQTVVAELGSSPKGASADLTARLSALDTTVAAKQLHDADLDTLAAGGAPATALLASLLNATYVSLGPTAVDVSTYSNDLDAAMAALPSGGGEIYVPSVCTTATGFTKTKSNITIRGTRKNYGGGSELRLTAPNKTLLANGTDSGNAYDTNEYDGPQGLGLYDLVLSYVGSYTALANGQGSGYGAGTKAIQDWRGGDVTLRNVRIQNFQDGFWGIQSDINDFLGVDLRYCKRGLYAGPRSDQFTIDRLTSNYCDIAMHLDGVFQTRVRNSQFIGDGASGVNPIKVGSAWARGCEGVIFDECWFEHVQGVAAIESFIEVGVGDTYQTLNLVIRDPYVLTGAQASANYAQYLVKLDNADKVSIQARSRSSAMGQLAGIIRDVGNSNKNMYVEADASLASILYSNGGSSTLTPVFVALHGGSADGLHVMRGSTGQTAFRTKRYTDSNDRWTVDDNGRTTWGDGSTGAGNADTNLYRNAVDQLKTDDALVVADALTVKTKAGTLADADFLHTPGDGTVAVNTTASRLAFRSGSVWRSVEPRDRLRPTAAFAETIPRRGSGLASQAVLSSGRASFYAIDLFAGEVVNSITFYAGSTPASGVSNLFFLLIDSSGNQLGVSADDAANGWSANASKTLALAAAATIATTGTYYVGVMVNGTPPTLSGISTTTAVAGAAPALSLNDTTHTGLTNAASFPSPWTISSTVGGQVYATVA